MLPFVRSAPPLPIRPSLWKIAVPNRKPVLGSVLSLLVLAWLARVVTTHGLLRTILPRFLRRFGQGLPALPLRARAARDLPVLAGRKIWAWLVAVLLAAPVHAQPVAMTVTVLYGGHPWGWIATADDAGNFYSADSRTQSIIRYRLGGERTILAGDGYVGLRDGAARQARFKEPFHMVRDRAGNLLVFDGGNFVIRKLTVDGQVSTLAGGSPIVSGEESKDGVGAAASFSYVNGMALDEAGNLYVAETYAIRQVAPDGRVTTWVRQPPGPGGVGRFLADGVTVDPAGNVLTFDDVQGAIVSVQSDGTLQPRLSLDRKNPVLAALAIVTGLKSDGAGNLYLTAVETGHAGWSSFRFSGGTVTALGEGYVFLDASKRAYLHSFAGLKRLDPGGADEVLFTGIGEAGFRDGNTITARFNAPTGIARDAHGQLFVADSGNNAIRKIDLDGQVTTLAGGTAGFADGQGTSAQFKYPAGLTFDRQGNLLVADVGNHAIRRISPVGAVTTLAGTSGVAGTKTGAISEVQFNSPTSVAVDRDGVLYVADSGNHRLVQIQGGTASMLFPGPRYNWYGITSVAVNPDNELYVSKSSVIYAVAPTTATNGTRVIRSVAGGDYGTRIHDGNGDAAVFPFARELAFDRRGYVYVADSYGYALRRISPARDVLTVAGDGHVGSAEGRGWDAQPGSPWGIVHDGNNGFIFTDSLQHSVRRAVWDLAAGPRILAQPADQNPGVGGPATFSLQFEGTFAPQLSWERRSAGTTSWVRLADDPVFTGTGKSVLRIAAAPLIMDGDEFRCVIMDEGRQVTSTSAHLAVNPELKPPTFYSQPWSRSVSAGATDSVTAAANPAPGYPAVQYQWYLNGVAVPGSTGIIHWLNHMDPSQSGIYTALATSAGTSLSQPAVVGVTSGVKVLGGGREVATNLTHSNGNVYDQILVTGTSVAVTADYRQATRTSFVDLNGDIVQVELSGPGTLSIVLDAATGPAVAAAYNQPDVQYMKGHAGIVLVGVDETSHLSIFTVGRATAIDQSLFRSDTAYDGVADIAFIGIFSPYSKFGGLRTANVHYWSTHGVAGVYAPKTHFSGPVYIGDISANDSATPMLVVGSAPEIRITGGSLLQPNEKPVTIDGFSRLQFSPGTDSHGRVAPAQSNRARFERGGLDVTGEISLVPTP